VAILAGGSGVGVQGAAMRTFELDKFRPAAGSFMQNGRPTPELDGQNRFTTLAAGETFLIRLTTLAAN